MLVGRGEALAAEELSERQRRRVRRFDDLVLGAVDERLFLVRPLAPEEEGTAAVLFRYELDDSVGERLPADASVRRRLVQSGQMGS